MKVIVLLIVFQLMAGPALMAQAGKESGSYNNKIDSLKRLLQERRDTARVNCLNNIARKFLERNDIKFKPKSDSAIYYATIAFREAGQLGYKYGMAKALYVFCYCHNLYSFHNRNTKTDNSKNIADWEINQDKLFLLATEINDPQLLGDCYYSESNLHDWKNNEQKMLVALEAAHKWYRLAKNETAEGEIATLIGYSYAGKGSFEKALGYFTNSLEIAKRINSQSPTPEFSQELVFIATLNVSDMYKTAGDYESAMNYLREYRQRNPGDKNLMVLEMADIFNLSGQPDSTLHYLEPSEWPASRRAITVWPLLGDAFLLAGNSDSAAHYFDLALDSLRKQESFWPVVQTALMRVCLGKAKILGQRGEPKAALALVKGSSHYALVKNKKMTLIKCYELQSRLFQQLGMADSAYAYLHKYHLVKDSVLTRQFLWKLTAYKTEAEQTRQNALIGFLDRDNKIKQEQLKRYSQSKKSILLGLAGLLIMAAIFFRYLLLKRRNERLRLEARALDLEMQALRSQMNPHFIFNSLASINRFILKTETETASNYLTRFSRLIRMVLVNSEKSFITLEDDLEMLTLYLDMERLRAKDSFDYKIIFQNRLDTGNIFIPPLLLQPFCENAIWHGLMQKPGQGELTIELNMQKEILFCTITDNGVGRNSAAIRKRSVGPAEKSMGMRITSERLALINRIKGFQTSCEIEDLVDVNGNARGTKVHLRIATTEKAGLTV